MLWERNWANIITIFGNAIESLNGVNRSRTKTRRILRSDERVLKIV